MLAAQGGQPRVCLLCAGGDGPLQSIASLAGKDRHREDSWQNGFIVLELKHGAHLDTATVEDRLTRQGAPDSSGRASVFLILRDESRAPVAVSSCAPSTGLDSNCLTGSSQSPDPVTLFARLTNEASVVLFI